MQRWRSRHAQRRLLGGGEAAQVQGARACHRATHSPCRAWTCRACGTRRSSPSCCRPRAASVPPPAPAAAPPR
eukprot:scaffold11366_cov36-Phaeocystis_antarctica.AAC.1